MFGGVLETVLDIPDLHPVGGVGARTWCLQVRREEDGRPVEWPVVGTDVIPGAGAVTLRQDSSGVLRLEYTDTGVFEISSDGSQVTWYRPRDVDEGLARTDILGRVMALAAQAQGIITLHASAVSLGGSVIGFMAPKYFGKSTLACALTDAGAALVTDDALAIRCDASGVMAAPGVPALRLREQSAVFLGRMKDSEAEVGGAWRYLERHDEHRVITGWTPLTSLYVLGPDRGENAATERIDVDRVSASLALVQHAKVAGLLGSSLAAQYLGTATQVVSQVPVFLLRFPRDLTRLAEVVAELRSWHEPSAVGPV